MSMEASQDDKATFIDTRRSRSESEAGSETGSEARPPSMKKRRKSEDSGSSLQERWDEMFDRLRRFKEAKGHCNVPNR